MKAIKSAIKALLPRNHDDDVADIMARKELPGTLEWTVGQAREMSFGRPMPLMSSLQPMEKQHSHHQLNFGGQHSHLEISSKRVNVKRPDRAHGGKSKVRVKRRSVMYPGWTTPNGTFSDRPAKYADALPIIRKPAASERGTQVRPQPSQAAQAGSSPNHANGKACGKQQEIRSRSRSESSKSGSRLVESSKGKIRSGGASTIKASSRSSGSSRPRVVVHAQAEPQYEQGHAPLQCAQSPRATPQVLAKASGPQHTLNRFSNGPQGLTQFPDGHLRAPIQNTNAAQIPAHQQYAPSPHASSGDIFVPSQTRGVQLLSAPSEQCSMISSASDKSSTSHPRNHSATQPTQSAASQTVSDSSLGEPDVNPGQSSYAASSRHTRFTSEKMQSALQQHTVSTAPTESSLGDPRVKASNASSSRSSKQQYSQPGSGLRGHTAGPESTLASSLRETDVNESVPTTSGASSRCSKATSRTSSSQASVSTVKADGNQYFAASRTAAPPARQHTFDQIRRTAPRAPSVDSQGNRKGTDQYEINKLDKRHKTWDEGVGAAERQTGTRKAPSVWSERSRRTAGGGSREHVYGRGERYNVAPCDAISHAGGMPFKQRPWHNGTALSTVYSQDGTAVSSNHALSNDPTERASEWWGRGGVEADPDAYAESATASGRTYWTTNEPSYWSVSPEQDETERRAEKDRIEKLKQRYREANAADDQL